MKSNSIDEVSGYLYLVCINTNYNGKNTRFLKIGFTRKEFKNGRISGYITHDSPFGFKLLGVKKGTLTLEQMFHVLLANKSLKFKHRTEWYGYSQNIINLFFTSTEKELGEYLWRNRSKYLNNKDRKSRQYSVYKHLNLIYLDNKEVLKEDDNNLRKLILNNLTDNNDNDNDTTITKNNGENLSSKCLINIRRIIDK